MAVTANIGFYLSGGVGNSDPNASLGGNPSSTQIEDIFNNLFDDVVGEQVEQGRTDYRCFYLVNDSGDTLADLLLWIDFEYEFGSDVEIGLTLRNEIQRLSFVGIPSGGTFKLRVDSYITNNIAYDFNFNTLASNIQTAIRALPNGADAECSPVTSSTFNVEFAGSNRNHKYPLIILDTNNLIGSGSPTITITSVQTGSPINLVQIDIDSATTPPTGITFFKPLVASPASVGWLKPTEVVGVWVRRITDPEAEPQVLDGFKLKINCDVIAGA